MTWRDMIDWVEAECLDLDKEVLIYHDEQYFMGVDVFYKTDINDICISTENL